MKENTFTKIATFLYSSEAIILKGKIESEGIAVFLFDNNTVDTDPMISNAIGGVKMFVYSENAEKAAQMVKEFNVIVEKEETEFDFKLRSENITNLNALLTYLKYSVINFFN